MPTLQELRDEMAAHDLGAAPDTRPVSLNELRSVLAVYDGRTPPPPDTPTPIAPPDTSFEQELARTRPIDLYPSRLMPEETVELIPESRYGPAETATIQRREIMPGPPDPARQYAADIAARQRLGDKAVLESMGPPTALDRTANVAANFWNSIGTAGTDAVKAGAVAMAGIEEMSGDDEDLKQYKLYQLGQYLKEHLDNAIPVDPGLRDEFFGSKLPAAFGSMAPYVALGMATGPAGPVALGMAQGGVQGYEEARAAGATHKDAMTSAKWNALLGVSEAFPTGRILDRFNKASGGQFERSVRKAIQQGGFGSIEEGLQEAFQQTGSNAIAMQIYDEERGIVDGTAESGAAGGIVGFVSSLIATIVGQRRMRLAKLADRDRPPSRTEWAEATGEPRWKAPSEEKRTEEAQKAKEELLAIQATTEEAAPTPETPVPPVPQETPIRPESTILDQNEPISPDSTTAAPVPRETGEDLPSVTPQAQGGQGEAVLGQFAKSEFLDAQRQAGFTPEQAESNWNAPDNWDRIRLQYPDPRERSAAFEKWNNERLKQGIEKNWGPAHRYGFVLKAQELHKQGKNVGEIYTEIAPESPLSGKDTRALIEWAIQREDVADKLAKEGAAKADQAKRDRVDRMVAKLPGMPKGDFLDHFLGFVERPRYYGEIGEVVKRLPPDKQQLLLDRKSIEFLPHVEAQIREAIAPKELPSPAPQGQSAKQPNTETSVPPIAETAAETPTEPEISKPIPTPEPPAPVSEKPIETPAGVEREKAAAKKRKARIIDTALKRIAVEGELHQLESRRRTIEEELAAAIRGDKDFQRIGVKPRKQSVVEKEISANAEQIAKVQAELASAQYSFPDKPKGRAPKQADIVQALGGDIAALEARSSLPIQAEAVPVKVEDDAFMAIKTAWRERFGGSAPSLGEIDSGRLNLRKFVSTVSEFEIDPVFEVVIETKTKQTSEGVDKRGKSKIKTIEVPQVLFRWYDGGTYTIVPEKFGIHPRGEFVAGQRIRVPVEAVKALKKGQVLVVDAPAASAPAGSGKAYAPSRPTGGQQPAASDKSVDATMGTEPQQQGAKVTLRPVQTPELVEIAEALLASRPKITKRLRQYLGLFKPQAGNPVAKILLKADMAVDPKMLAQTLAHELGHAIDYLPDLTLKRGNILGRIASLSSYLKQSLPGTPGGPGILTDADKKRLLEEARKMRDVSFEEEIDLYIEKTMGITPRDVLNIFNATADTAINKDLEDYIKRLDTKQKKAVVAEALKGRLKGELQKFVTTVRTATGIKFTFKGRRHGSQADVMADYKRLVADEIRKRALLENQVIRSELIALTTWWSGPFNPKTSYGKYRTSSVELYAEALSVLLRAPSELSTRAPMFFRGFMAYLDTKPDVRDELLNVMQLLNGTPADIAEHRTERVQKMFSTAEQQVLAVDTARKTAGISTAGDIFDTLFGHLVDRHAPLTSRVKRAKKVPGFLDKAENAQYIMDELNNTDRDLRAFLTWSDKEVLRPLAEVGVGENEIGEYLMMHRIIEETAEAAADGGDRWDVANPLGFDPEAAASQIEALKDRIGEDAYDLLESKMKKWHDGVFWFAEEAARVGVYSKDQFETTIRPNKDKYATFAVVKHYQGKITSALRQQIGTFEDIINPFTGTMMKMVTLNRMNRLNEAKATVVKFLQESFPQEVAEVDIPYGEREPNVPPPPGFEHLIVFEDGKPHAYKVPENIARMYKSHDIGSASIFARLMNSAAYRLFHPLYVTFSPGFVVANTLFRDPKRTFINLPAAVKLHAPGNRVTTRQLVTAYIKAAPSAWKRAWGIDDKVILQMEEEGTLKGLWTKANQTHGGIPQTKLRSMLSEYGVTTIEESQKAAHGFFQKILRAVEGVGMFGETLTNVAANEAMRVAGVPLRERRYIVKKYAGTPDVLQRGWANPVTNSLFMYWKVRMNGMQADLRLATSPKSAADWWFRRFIHTFVPKLLTFAATAGLLGEYIKQLMADIPDEAKQNATPIPLGRIPHKTPGLGKGKDGKVIYFNVIEDDMGRFLGSLVWHGLQMAYPTDDRKATERLQMSVEDAYGAVVPGLNPVMDIGRVWASYAIGRNPYDPFLGRNILNNTEEEAGGWPAAKKLMWWTSQKFGVVSTLLHLPMRQAFGRSGLEESEDTYVEAAAETFAGFQRIIKITDRGRSEALWTAVENESQEDAKFLASLPVDVRRATNYRYLLNRRGPENLAESELIERSVLNWWYAKSYTKLTHAIKQAEADGDTKTAKELRDVLLQSIRDMSEIVANPE